MSENPPSGAPALARGGAVLIRVALLVGVCVLAYQGSFHVPFFSDDIRAIPMNGNIRTLWPLTESMVAPKDTTLAGRPAVTFSFALNYRISEYDVESYHVVNLLLHIAVALLVAALVDRALRSDAFGGRFQRRTASMLGTGVGLVWALHPLNTEAVVYTVQRTELMFAVFLLLTLWASTRVFESVDGSSRAARVTWIVLAVLFCALGMASKEVMVVAPVLILLYDRTLVSGSFGRALRRHGVLYAGLAATWFLLGFIVASQPRSLSAGFGLSVTPIEYLYTQAQVVVWYLRLAFLPFPLSVTHPWPVVRQIWTSLPHGLLLISLLGATVWALWRNRAIGLLGAWFFLILAPSSSIVPIPTEIAAERRMYMPLAAIVVLVVVGGYRLLSRWDGRRAAAGSTLAVVVLAGALGLATHQRVQAYETTETLWRSALEIYPDDANALTNLAIELRAAGDDREAEALLRRSLEIAPENAPTLSNLGGILLDRGSAAEAIPIFERALSIDATEARLHSNYGAALGAVGREKEAADALQRAIEIDPYLADAYVNIGVLLAGSGALEHAAGFMQKALELEPEHETAREYLRQLIRAIRENPLPEGAPGQP